MQAIRRLFTAALLLLLTAPIGAEALAQAPASTPVREITQIRDGVYRFRNNNHYSIFVVTPAGVIATDPINAEAARWLQDQIRAIFNQPIRYVVYSHDHADHISGGEVWAGSAVVIAHANAKRAIRDERRPTAIPAVTFTDRLDLELGGTVVELHYVGRNHSDNSVVVRLPKERVAFAVDFIPVNAMAFRDFPDAYLTDWIDSLHRVEAMEFDIFAPGHGPLGTKDSVRAFRSYMETLRDQVTRLARAGDSLDAIKQKVDLRAYESWAGYQQMRDLNIEGMFRLVQANRRGN